MAWDMQDREKSKDQLIAELATLRALVEGVPALIASFERVDDAGKTDYRFTAFNQLYQQEFEHIFGFRPQVGLSLSQALASFPQSLSKMRAALDQAMAGDRLRTVETLAPPATEYAPLGDVRLVSGDRSSYEITYSPLRDANGTITGVFLIGFNITPAQDLETAHQQTEAALRKSKGETELRVAERTAELISVNQKLQQELEERKRVEAALRVSQARFAGILEIADDAIISVNLEQQITLFNQGAERIFGYTAAEVLGKPLDILLPQSAIAAHRSHVQNFGASSGKARRMGEHALRTADERRPIFGRRKDGTEFPAEASISKLSQGGETIFTVILRDISEQKEAEETLQRLSHQNELLLNAIGEGLCGLDRQGRITFANPAALRLLGYTQEELIGSPVDLILPHTRPDGTPYPFSESPIYTSLRDGAVRQVNTEQFWRRNGSSLPVEYVSTPIWEEGEIVGAVIAFRDITERQQVERMKDEFISVVSHELRTPLTSIHGSLGMLASGLLDPTSERGKRLLQIAVDSTDRLVRLINDILDIERIESGKVKMAKEICEVEKLLTEAVDTVQAIADKAGITLKVSSCSASFYADADRIIQTLTNLLSNAIKFSPRGETVYLSAERIDSPVPPLASDANHPPRCPLCQPPYLLFTVKDQGRGIPADKLDTIFERFQQVDASDSRNNDGTGLGLAICRSIVHQHNGQIWVESTLGVGSTFYFTIPLAGKGGSLATNAPLPATADLPKGPLVLVCDDDPSTLSVLQALLEQRGYQVVTVESGAKAIEVAIARQPDVILLDMMMPEMNGWDVMANLKARPETRNIPILVCSVIPEAEAQAEVRSQKNYVGWVDKPLNSISLFQSLRSALTGHSQKLRILIIEDDVDLAEVFCTLFQHHNIETYCAHTGREAIRLSQQLNPDLLVLDLSLPDGDGFVVVEWLRQHNRLSSVPLVVYSAQDVNEEERDRLRLGQTEFLTKGRVSTQEFEHRVLDILNGITKAE